MSTSTETRYEKVNQKIMETENQRYMEYPKSR